MRRWIAVLWNTSFLVLAGVLYFFFVLPRWPEMIGDTSHTLGTALRIVTGALIGLAALPVVFSLLRTRRPEFGTPRLALALRVWSIALHVLAGALIIGAAISEIWLSLDSAGPWLFGIYGAAAAIAVLGLLAFQLAFTAELPPPPPKPLKSKTQNRRRGRGRAADEASADEESVDEADAPAETEVADADEVEKDDAPAPVAVEEPSKTSEAVELTETTAADETTEANEVDEPANIGEPDDDRADNDEETAGKLRNRRPSGKSLFRRSRGGVALED